MASAPVEYTLGKDQMPNVERAVHLGIIRTTCALDNIKENVDENMKKARRSANALFGCGFHGENGLDPETMMHLFKTYITPVLLYGMEVLIPKGKYLEQLNKFQKKMIKQLLSISSNTLDPAIYLLTELLPIEAQIHIRALTLFGNVCRQDEACIEKQLAKRQLRVQSMNSNSWFIEIQVIMYKYNLGDALYWIAELQISCVFAFFT
jgi:hypothetical protein